MGGLRQKHFEIDTGSLKGWGWDGDGDIRNEGLASMALYCTYTLYGWCTVQYGSIQEYPAPIIPGRTFAQALMGPGGDERALHASILMPPSLPHGKHKVVAVRHSTGAEQEVSAPGHYSPPCRLMEEEDAASFLPSLTDCTDLLDSGSRARGRTSTRWRDNSGRGCGWGMGDQQHASMAWHGKA